MNKKIVLNGNKKNIKSVPGFLNYGKKGLDIEDNLISLVNKGLISSRRVERVGRLHARDTGLCERQGTLSALQDGMIVDNPQSKSFFALGNAIEDLVLTSLFVTGNLLFKNYKIPDIGINLGGAIDGIVYLNDKIRILEIKSCGKLPDKPKPEHVAQALMYSAITGLHSTVFYFSRYVIDKWGGPVLMKQFDLDENIELGKKALWRAIFASIAVKENLIPDKPVHLKKSDCGFCPFVSNCWNGEHITVGKPISQKDNLRISREASQILNQILDFNEVKNRRIGILKFLSISGNQNAKSILSKSEWSDLI